MRLKHQQDLRWSREKEKWKHREDHFLGCSENPVMGHVVGVMGVVLLEESGSPESLNHQKPPLRLTSRWTWVGRWLSKALTSLWICSRWTWECVSCSWWWTKERFPIPFSFSPHRYQTIGKKGSGRLTWLNFGDKIRQPELHTNGSFNVLLFTQFLLTRHYLQMQKFKDVIFSLEREKRL